MDKLNQWLTLIANVGVLAGVLFLAIEVRHSSVAITAQTQDSIADGFIDLNLATINDPNIGLTLEKGLADPHSLSRLEAIRFSMQFRALFNQFRRVHSLYKSDLISESQWALYAREAAYFFSTPGGQLYFTGNEIEEGFREDIQRYGSQKNVDLSLGRNAGK